jgi:hypothetical protein
MGNRETGINFWDPNFRLDFVAEGVKVTLVFEADPTQKTYTVPLAMPGEAPRENYGVWYLWDHGGRPQIDFWPG